MLLKEGGTFVNAPADTHPAVCVDFVDLGIVSGTWDGQPRSTHRCRVVYEIPATMENGQRYTVSRTFTASLSETANLRKFLESWRGRPFTAEELKGFESENLIGVNALIQVIHAKKGERTYANINSVMRLPQGMLKLTPSKDYIRVKDRPAENGDGPPSHHAEGPPIEEEVPF